MEKLVQLSREFALQEIEQYGLPHVLQFDISEKKAIELAQTLWAKQNIVAMGVYLMDIKLGQAFQENRANEHVSMSSEVSKTFLESHNIDHPSLLKIINCIEAHHGEIPFTSLESEICANADCYKFIHPRGFFLFLAILGKRWLSFNDCLDQAEFKLDEKYKILSLDVCKTELEPYYQTLKKYISDSRHF
jgi:hypothetical protein